MAMAYLTAGINVQLLQGLPNMKDARYLIQIKTAYSMIKINVLTCQVILNWMVVLIRIVIGMVLQIIKTAVQMSQVQRRMMAVSYTHLRAHETGRNLVCRLLLEKKKK